MLVGPRGSGRTTTGYFLLELLRRTRGYVPLSLCLTLHCYASCDAPSFWVGLSTSLQGCARELGVELIHFHDAAGFQDVFRASRWLGQPRFVLMIDEFDALERLPSDLREQVRLLRSLISSACIFCLKRRSFAFRHLRFPAVSRSSTWHEAGKHAIFDPVYFRHWTLQHFDVASRNAFQHHP